jgi:hypothetical protein
MAPTYGSFDDSFDESFDTGYLLDAEAIVVMRLHVYVPGAMEISVS